MGTVTHTVTGTLTEILPVRVDISCGQQSSDCWPQLCTVSRGLYINVTYLSLPDAINPR